MPYPPVCASCFPNGIDASALGTSGALAFPFPLVLVFGAIVLLLMQCCTRWDPKSKSPVEVGYVMGFRN